jgi:hypothetical protein
MSAEKSVGQRRQAAEPGTVGMPVAQCAKRIRPHDDSDVSVRVEGPRRGPEPREDRPKDRWKRWSSVHIHLRSNASKVLHHAVLARTSSPVTVAGWRRELRGKRTSWRQRSWRHDAAAGGGNPPGGTKRAAGSRRSRHRLHVNHRKVAGAGCRESGRKVGARQRPDETQRTPGSAAGCNKPASPSLRHRRKSGLRRRVRRKPGKRRRKPARSCETAKSERESKRGSLGQQWTPGMRSTEGRRSPGHERSFGSNVGGKRASLGRIPREEVGNPRPGLVGTRTLERSEAQEGRRSMVAAMRDVETAKRLDLEGPAERSVRTDEAREWPTCPQEQQRRWTTGIGVSRFRSPRP